MFPHLKALALRRVPSTTPIASADRRRLQGRQEGDLGRAPPSREVHRHRATATPDAWHLARYVDAYLTAARLGVPRIRAGGRSSRQGRKK